MDTSFHIKPFNFDRVFSVSAPEAEPAPGDLQLQIAALQNELERMQADRDQLLALARSDGFQAGLAQARTERENALLAAVDALQSEVERLDRRFAEVETRLTAEAAELALSAADLIAGRALEHAPAAALAGALSRALDQLGPRHELNVRVHPALRAEIEQYVADLHGREQRRLPITIVEDGTLAIGDGAITWEEGGILLDTDTRRVAIRDELDSFLAPAAPAARDD